MLEELKKINSDDDVAILARTNDELKEIAAFLEENGRKYVLNNKNNFTENSGIFECVEFLKYLVYDDELALFNFISSSLSNFGTEEIEYLLAGLDKIIYVDIALEKDKDDPQKIFESLNSTGLDLSQGDLIRNYILMDLERGEQNRIYKEIWIPIENNCKVSDGSEITSYVSDFIRDYLTLKTEKISSKPKVFETFKAYYEKENDEKLEDMKKYSEAYS